MKTNYVLIDYENIQVPTISLLKAEHFRVLLFLGPNNTTLRKDLVLSLQQLHDRLEFINMDGCGKNALDFHIAYHLGKLARENPDGFFHIISKDKGFDPLIKHMKTERILAARSESIEALPCLQPAPVVKVSKSDTEEQRLTDLVIANLRKRKTGKPGRLKTLLGTIRDVCGKDLPESKIETVLKGLVKKSYVKVEGTKVQFSGL